MTDLPSYDLELQAAEERKQLHKSVEELKTKLHERTDLRHLTRKHLAAICGVTGALALAAGYGFTSIFVRR